MASLNPIQVTTSGFSAATGQIVKVTAKNICTLSDKVLNFVQTYYYWGSNSGTLANLLTAFLDPTKSAYAKGMALVHSDLNKSGGAIGTVTAQSLTSTKRFYGLKCLTMAHYGPARASLPGVSDITRRRLSNQGKR